MEKIKSKNPSDGSLLKELDQTPLEIIPDIILRAREAQKNWATLSAKKRADIVLNVREYILDHLQEIAELIHIENGKPKAEAILHDLMPAMEVATVYCSRAPKLLRDKKIPLRWMKTKQSYLQYWPKGVVAIISPWNFPFSIPFGEIVLALLAGNAVVFKPSEVTPLVGLKILEVFEQSFLPKNLVQVVLGDGSRGAAIIKSHVDKICFTGSVATGKKVMASAAEHLTPVVLELGGKDPMIVLPGSDLDFATSAALWGGFANSGQCCASTERVLVHEKDHDTFVSLLKEKVQKLRALEDGGGDLGFITFDNQKKIYEEQLSELNTSNSNIVVGGKFNDSKTRLYPTIVTNPNATGASNPIENTKIYNEETFGPVLAITKYTNIREAIEKANHNRYGLLASVIGQDLHLAEQVARQIEAGSVLINDVLYTHALAETPWGGIKDSGFGKVHSDSGLLEFCNTRHINKPLPFFGKIRAMWWFPYSPHQLSMFLAFSEFLYRRSFLRKLRAVPSILVEFVQMIKKEKRY